MVHLKWTVFKACTFWLCRYYYYLRKKKSVLSITYQTTNKCPKLVFKCMQSSTLTFPWFVFLLCACAQVGGQCVYLQVRGNLYVDDRFQPCLLFPRSCPHWFFGQGVALGPRPRQLGEADWPAGPYLRNTEAPSSCPHRWLFELGTELKSSYSFSKHLTSRLCNPC